MQVHLKLESEQRTGSFKARGAVNKVGHCLTASPRACLPIDVARAGFQSAMPGALQILSIPPHQLSKGLVTSSTGNHALAFLHACKVLRQQHPEITIPRPRVYLPSTASQFKASWLVAAPGMVQRLTQAAALPARISLCLLTATIVLAWRRADSQAALSRHR